MQNLKSQSQGTPSALPTDQALAPALAALPKAQAQAISKPRRPRAAGTADELEARRRLKARVNAKITKLTDTWMQDATYHRVSLPYLTIVAAGSLAAASAVQAIGDYSEHAWATTKDEWVFRTLQEWMDSTGLSEDEWMTARHALRDLGIVRERRRFAIAFNGIVTELAFSPDVWATRLSKVRQDIRDGFRDQVEMEHGLRTLPRAYQPNATAAAADD